MKPYNCNCIYISQVSELKAQKEELLGACKMMMKKHPYADGMMEIAQLIKKIESNE